MKVKVIGLALAVGLFMVGTYQGKKDGHFVSSGVFTWNKAGNTISLKSADGKSDSNYFVGENRLFRLDKEGNRVTGPLADNYSLKKQ